LCIKSEDGYYTLGGLPGFAEPPDTDDFYFIFQGRNIPIQIGDPPPQVTEEDLEIVVYPEILEQLKKHIEYDVNFKKIRKSTVDKYSN